MSAEIPFEEFVKVDLRVGTVSNAQRVEKSDKLLRLEVQFGAEIGPRVIVAGIAEAFPVEALMGRQVLAVVNLPPRKLFGIESHGMLLATKDDIGRLFLPVCPGAPDGARLG